MWRRLRELAERFERGEAICAGVLSGTSADGIDVALARFSATRALAFEDCVAFETVPFPEALAARVRRVLDGGPCDLRETALLSRDLGLAFGDAVNVVAREHGRAVDLVASHGQTVYHHDGREPSGPATLQLGDGDFVAERTSPPCVSDFRQRDVAAGGEGAPLSALADPILFAKAPRPLALLNLGGMANFTLLGDGDSCTAFDTGPANAMLDGLTRRLLDEPCDRDGAGARAGRVDEEGLRALLAHPFLDAAPPKSTGRDTFGAEYIDGWLAGRSGARPTDLLATATRSVARAAAQALSRWGGEVASGLSAVHVCGGGVHNPALLEALGEELGLRVASTAELSVDPDAREALVFAWLGAAAALGLPLTRPGATGAAAGRVPGKFSTPPA